MRSANHKRIALFSPKMRWNVGSIVLRSRSVSLTSNTISGEAAILLTPVQLSVRDSGHAGEEIGDDGCDLGATTLQRKMAGIEQVDFGLRVVALEGLRASGQKEWIVL